MSIAMFVGARMQSYVRHVLVGEREIVAAHSWGELDAIIRRDPVTAVILDPAADGVMNVTAVANLFKRYPSLPLVVYVAFTPASVNAVAELSRDGLQNVVLEKIQDSPDEFRATLARARQNPLADQALNSLRPHLKLLPLELDRAVREMFQSPHRFLVAQDLAIASRMSSARISRCFQVTGLGSPRKYLVAARLLRGYTYLRDPGHSIRDVAKKLGYRDVRVFAEHSNSVFRLSPSRLRSELAPEVAVERLVEWLTCEMHDDARQGDA